MRDDSGSYDEIMRLTSSRSRGEQASAYDFRKTEKFSGDQLKFLQRIFTTFAESVTTNLAPLTQSKCNFSLLNIAPRTYHSYLNSLSDNTPIMVFKVDQDVSGFIDIEFSLAFALFERLMGGKGQPPRENARSVFTDLEKTILRKPLIKLLDAYNAAWKDTKPVKTQLVNIEFNSMAVHIANPSELMVVIPFQAEIAQAIGAVNILLPFRYLKDIIPKSSFDEFVLTRETSTNASAEKAAPFLTKKLEAAKVPIIVSLGRAELLFQELLTIEVGDTIRLDTEIGQPLRIKVDNHTKFLGFPGVKDKKMACKVSKVLQEGDEEFDE